MGINSSPGIVLATASSVVPHRMCQGLTRQKYGTANTAKISSDRASPLSQPNHHTSLTTIGTAATMTAPTIAMIINCVRVEPPGERWCRACHSIRTFGTVIWRLPPPGSASESEETTIQAIVRSEYGLPEVLHFEDAAIPVPKDDEVLVRVRASSVNMADVDFLLGRPTFARIGTGLRAPKNRGLGLDVAGVVEAIAGNVTRFRPGDEVFGDLTEHGFGAFAEYVCAAEDAFAPKPIGLTFEAAASVPQAGVMALQGLGGKRPIQPGQQVLVNGAGGNIGPFAVQIAKSFGAEVTGVDSADKLDMLRSIGADHVIDYAEVDYTKTGRHYDRILDIAVYRSIRESRKALRPEGVYVMVPGSISGVFQGAIVGPLTSIVGRRTMGMHMWKPFNQADVALLTELLEAGDVVPVIDRVYPLSDVAEALRYQEQGLTRGKIVITVAARG